MADLLQQLQMPQLEAMCEQLYNSQVIAFSFVIRNKCDHSPQASSYIADMASLTLKSTNIAVSDKFLVPRLHCFPKALV